jgi:hypothetical protein
MHRAGVGLWQVGLATYEMELLRYGFDVMRDSVEMGPQGQNPLP